MLKIAYVGRFAVPKRNLALLDIYDAIINIPIDFVIDVYGDAESGDSYGLDIKRKFISRSSRYNKINILGHVEGVQSRLKSYDILLLVSQWEGWPLVMIEAASHGCIPICTDVMTGPREFIADIYDYNINIEYPFVGVGGILMPPDFNNETISIWANQIHELSKNQDLLRSLKNDCLNRSLDYKFSTYKKYWIDEITKLLQ